MLCQVRIFEGEAAALGVCEEAFDAPSFFVVATGAICVRLVCHDDQRFARLDLAGCKVERLWCGGVCKASLPAARYSSDATST